MKILKLSVDIARSAHEVFEFTTNPDNTPLWVDGIVKEETNELPCALGTIFKNLDHDGNATEFRVTSIESDRIFELNKIGSDLHVKYEYTPLATDRCSLEYSVWVDAGEIDNRFGPDELLAILTKLKEVLESMS